jgi:hypothetical protein
MDVTLRDDSSQMMRGSPLLAGPRKACEAHHEHAVGVRADPANNKFLLKKVSHIPLSVVTRKSGKHTRVA